MSASISPEQPEKMYLPRSSESPQLQKIRHTASHVMAMAVQKLFPKAQVTIGPAIENRLSTLLVTNKDIYTEYQN